MLMNGVRVCEVIYFKDLLHKRAKCMQMLITDVVAHSFAET